MDATMRSFTQRMNRILEDAKKSDGQMSTLLSQMERCEEQLVSIRRKNAGAGARNALMDKFNSNQNNAQSNNNADDEDMGELK